MSLRCPVCGSAFRGTCHSRQCETARTRATDEGPDAAPPKEVMPNESLDHGPTGIHMNGAPTEEPLPMPTREEGME